MTSLTDRLEQAARQTPERYSFKPLTDWHENLSCDSVSVGICAVSNRKNRQGSSILKAAVKRFYGWKLDWQEINAVAQSFCDKLNACKTIQEQQEIIKAGSKREFAK